MTSACPLPQQRKETKVYCDRAVLVSICASFAPLELPMPRCE